MNVEDILDKTIIICNNNYKKKLLKELTKKHLFKDIKFYDKKSFIENYYFSYSKECLPYLINKYHLKIDILNNFLDKLYYIEDKEYHNKKLQFLKDLKQELIDNNLIIYNNFFKEYIKDYQIIVIGYPYLDKLFNNINIKVINETYMYKHDTVYEFKNIEDEVEFVMENIIDLLNDNININNIKLMNVTSEYYNELNKYSKLYNIPIKVPCNNNLYSKEIVKIFLNNIYKGIDNALKEITMFDKDIVNKIINICNKYNFIHDIDVLKEILIYEFKKTNIDNFNYKNYIEIISTLDKVDDNDYVFLMNFNTSSIPNFIKDEDYIKDNIKEELDLDKTNVINSKIKNFTINKINSIKNLYISYKLKDNKTIYYPSILIKELNLNIKEYKCNNIIHYAYILDKLKLAKMLYNYEAYNIIDDNLYLYKNSINDLNYNSYDNKYKGIDKNKLKEYLNNKLYLSYSHINNYHKCAFRYYLNNILKLKRDNDLFEAFIGSLLHNALQKCIDSDLDSDIVISDYIKTSNRDLSKKEEYFINLLKEDLKRTIKIIKEQNNNIKLDKILKEQYIAIDKSKDIEVQFVGFIDKILYKEFNNRTVVALVDYKSGKEDIDLTYKDYGFNLQLPIYLYLIKNSELFNNIEFAGFYLQYILDKNILISDKSYEEEEKERLKLVGYSNNDVNILKNIDINYQNSNLIKGLKCKNNGEFYKNSKVISNEEIDDLIKLVDDKINEDITNILDAKFDINPKKIGYKEDIGCKYCKYYDICFKKERDYIILDEIEGDKDAELD